MCHKSGRQCQVGSVCEMVLGPFRFSPTSPTCADTGVRDQFCHILRVSLAYLTGPPINWRRRRQWRRRWRNKRPLGCFRRPRTCPELARLRNFYGRLRCSNPGPSLCLLGFAKTSVAFLGLERVRERHPSYGVLKNLLGGHLDPSHSETRRLLCGNGVGCSHFNRQAMISILQQENVCNISGFQSAFLFNLVDRIAWEWHVNLSPAQIAWPHYRNKHLPVDSRSNRLSE